MSLKAFGEALPDYAKDLRLNLESVRATRRSASSASTACC